MRRIFFKSFDCATFLRAVLIFLPVCFPPELFAGEKDAIDILSRAFKSGGEIPARFTCDAENISPPLEWGDLPPNTESVVLIMEDPDAAAGTWVHWVLYNLPPFIHSLPEGMPAVGKLIYGERQGINDFKKLGYGGPCPPSGSHRYFFRIYALDRLLNLPEGASKAQVEAAMKGHVLASGEWMGRYERRS